LDTTAWLDYPAALRFVVLNERVREGKSAVGRVLLDVPGYTYRIFVINRTESAVIIWRDYSGRACMEQRTEKPKTTCRPEAFACVGSSAPGPPLSRCSSPST